MSKMDEVKVAGELVNISRVLVGLDRVQKDDLSRAVDELVRSLNLKIVEQIEKSASDFVERRLQTEDLEPFSGREAEIEYRALAIMRLAEVLKRSR